MERIWYSKSHHFCKDLRCCNKAHIGDFTLLMPISLFSLKNMYFYSKYSIPYTLLQVQNNSQHRMEMEEEEGEKGI